MSKQLRVVHCEKQKGLRSKGAFNNYVDQILPNFDPQPSSGQKWTIYILTTLCHVNPCGLSTDPNPPLLVHVVIECPLSTALWQSETKMHNTIV